MESTSATTRSATGNPPARCWAEIDLAALRHNAAEVARLCGDGRRVMAVVKADAYHHGVREVAQALRDQVAFFGVASLQEGLSLRDELSSGDSPDIFVLGPLPPQDHEAALAADLVLSLSTVEEAVALSQAAAKAGKSARAHLVVDTGMGRIGCLEREFADFVSQCRTLPRLKIEGLATHFPDADGPDPAFTRGQIQRFQSLIFPFRAAWPEAAAPWIHLSNSAGLLRFSEDCAPFETLVRPGLALYGLSPVSGLGEGLRPVLSLKTQVTLVRELPKGHGISYGRTFVTSADRTRVATLGIGYADGYRRHLSNRGADALIGGRRCPVLGNVTMDQIMADVSHLPEAPTPGDEAILIGHQENEHITAEELATKAGTISWEILTGITNRVTRVYVDGQ